MTCRLVVLHQAEVQARLARQSHSEDTEGEDNAVLELG